VDLKWQGLLRDMERRVIWHPGWHQHNNGRIKNRVLKDRSIVSEALRERLSGERTWNSASIVIFLYFLFAHYSCRVEPPGEHLVLLNWQLKLRLRLKGNY
jgi:hypothetical protein